MWGTIYNQNKNKIKKMERTLKYTEFTEMEERTGEGSLNIALNSIFKVEICDFLFSGWNR